MKRTVTLLVLTLALSLAGAQSLKKWQSPDKFYWIELPVDWEQVKGEPDIQTFVFKPTTGEAEIEISAAYDLHLPETLPPDVLELAFQEEKPINAIARIRGNQWDGLRRDYINAAQTKRSSAIAARNGSTVVLLIMTAPAIEFARFEDVFKHVAESLHLGK